jgi:very-short-patch-repair endonuclease
MADKPANPDWVLARVAGRQHGVVAARQLTQLGLSRDQISDRAAAGRLHRIHRGVYAAGHTALSDRGRWVAAVLAAGDAAVLSHRSAAELLALLPARPGAVHVTTPTRAGRATRSGLVIHRTILPLPSIRHHGVPVTTAARTLADLGRVVTAAERRQALRTAQRLGYRTGSATPLPTRSELEDLTLALFRRHRIPPPLVNQPLGSYVVDFLWPTERLIVETDGFEFHSGRAAFEADRERQNALVALGYEVLRFTYAQVTGSPRSVATTVRRALARRAKSASGLPPRAA